MKALESTNRLYDRFEAATLQLRQAVIQLAGATSLPVTSRSVNLEHFSYMDSLNQIRTIEMVEGTLACCAEMILEGAPVLDSRLISKKMLNRMRIRYRDDAFQTYEPGDLIDFYNHKSLMIFASPSIFLRTSYSIEELYCRPWQELWGRPADISLHLQKKALEVTSEGCEKNVFLETGDYLIRELDSPLRKQVHIRGKLFSPIVDREGNKGFLSLNTISS